MAEIRIDAPGIYQIDSKTYHSDSFLPAPGLSSGIAKVLIKQSAAHAWTKHPRCDWFEQEEKGAWDLGAAAHSIMLEGEAGIMLVRANSYLTDAAKAARNAAYAKGQIPMLPHQLDEARSMVEAVRAQLTLHETDSDAFTDGRPEVTVVWQEKNGVWCRARPDWMPNDPKRFWDDFKTSGTSANPDVVGRWAMNQGIDIQEAFYRRGARAVVGHKVNWRFVMAENKPPYAMTVFTLPKIVQEMADEQVEMAIRMWGRCLESGRWPAYPPYRVELDPPPWATKEWETRRERAKFEGAEKFDPVLAEIVKHGFAPVEQEQDDLDRLMSGEL